MDLRPRLRKIEQELAARRGQVQPLAPDTWQHAVETNLPLDHLHGFEGRVARTLRAMRQTIVTDWGDDAPLESYVAGAAEDDLGAIANGGRLRRVRQSE